MKGFLSIILSMLVSGVRGWLSTSGFGRGRGDTIPDTDSSLPTRHRRQILLPITHSSLSSQRKNRENSHVLLHQQQSSTDWDKGEEDNADEDTRDEKCWDLCDLDGQPFVLGERSYKGAIQNAVDKAIQGGDVIDKKQERREIDDKRVALQMQWELEENQEQCNEGGAESCSLECPDCHGRGYITCRFCQGTKVAHLPAMYGQEAKDVDCPVCNRSGQESCQSCRGTGYRAEWTALVSFTP